VRREDLMVKNEAPFRRSHNPPTMASGGQPHGADVHPAVAQHVTHLAHPHTGHVFSHRESPHWEENHCAVRPETKSDSLQPSDPAHDKTFLQRCRDKFARLLEMCGG